MSGYTYNANLLTRNGWNLGWNASSIVHTLQMEWPNRQLLTIGRKSRVSLLATATVTSLL